MNKATKDFLNEIDALAEARRTAILNAPDKITVKGKTYYVSAAGNDENDGLTPESAWRSLDKVTHAKLSAGDGVLFRRGDLFRGIVYAQAGVTYAAYGEGEKPRFYGWDRSLADPALWTLYDAEHHIWKLNEKILDCGNIVFNGGEYHCYKHIPSYINGRFVCRDDESRVFEMANEMKNDLDMTWFYTERMTEVPTKGQDFPVPFLDESSYGDLYLRCDRGNPGEVFEEVEAVPRRCMFRVGREPNVTIDNVCIKYVGVHAVAAGGHSVGLHVSNCEIGWIGGTIQNYLGTDPNYPQGGRGTVTRYGNGIEVYGGCEDYVVSDCYIYQCYDAGITHQITTKGNKCVQEGIRYLNNLVEYCVYSIEYFLEKTDGDTESYIRDCEMSGNILRFSGYGWGQQRHNIYTPAHIKGWSYENTASEYSIHNNIFDRAAYRMLHLVAKKQESCPDMYENTYIQHIGLPLGQYGANEVAEPANMVFDETADRRIADVLSDKNAKIYYIAR